MELASTPLSPALSRQVGRGRSPSVDWADRYSQPCRSRLGVVFDRRCLCDQRQLRLVAVIPGACRVSSPDDPGPARPLSPHKVEPPRDRVACCLYQLRGRDCVAVSLANPQRHADLPRGRDAAVGCAWLLRLRDAGRLELATGSRRPGRMPSVLADRCIGGEAAALGGAVTVAVMAELVLPFLPGRTGRLR